MESACRLCSKYSEELKSMFSFKNGHLLCDLVSSICPIKIDINDPFPKKICRRCLALITETAKLRETSVQVDETFRSGTFAISEPEEVDEENEFEQLVMNEPRIGLKRPRRSMTQEVTSESDDDLPPRSINENGRRVNTCEMTDSRDLVIQQQLNLIDTKVDILIEAIGGRTQHHQPDLGTISTKHWTNQEESDPLIDKSGDLNNETSVDRSGTFFANCLTELNEIDKILLNEDKSLLLRKLLKDKLEGCKTYQIYMKKGVDMFFSDQVKLSFGTVIKSLRVFTILVGESYE